MKFIFFLLLLISSLSAIAEIPQFSNEVSAIRKIKKSDLAYSFKASSTTIIDALLNKGISRLGRLDLLQFKKQISKTDWRVLTFGFVQGSGKFRTSSIYLEKESYILVSEDALKLVDPTVFPLLSLHEALGANGYGYADENYESVLSLWQLSQQPDLAKEIFENIVGNIIERPKENKIFQLAGGGGTSVGGGGDGVALEIKFHIFKQAIALLQNASLEDATQIKSVVEKVLKTAVDCFLVRNEKADVAFYDEGEYFRIQFSAPMWIDLTLAKNTFSKEALAKEILQFLRSKYK